MESQAMRKLEQEIRHLVEKPDAYTPVEGKTVETSLIEAISNQVKGKKQMDRLL